MTDGTADGMTGDLKVNPGATRRARIAATFLAVATLSYAAHLALVPMGETDLFFHLKLGDIIRARHAIPFRNLFSYTYPDQPDLDLSWAFQVMVSFLHQLGGFPAIAAMKAVLFVTACALVHRACRRGGAGPMATALTVVVTALAAEQRLVERPHLITFVGLTGFGLLLVEAERGRKRLLYILPGLTIIWANFHAGAFLAPILLATYSVGAALDGRARNRHETQSSQLSIPQGRLLFLLTALVTAAIFFTPAGALLPRYLLWHTGLGATRIIEEFRLADPWNDPWFFVLLTAGALTVLALRKKTPWRLALPALLVAPLAYRSVRFVAEWAFMAAPLVAIGLSQLETAWSVDRPLSGGVLKKWLRSLAMPGLSIVLLGCIVSERRNTPFSLDLDEEVVPFEAIDFVTKNGLRERLYHDLDVGCYLLWEGWPRYRVFQDARLPAYPDAFHRALDQTPLEPAAWDALLKQYGVETALINYPYINMRAGSFDPEEWALVYRAEDAMVFVRRLPKWSTVIEHEELPIRVRFNFMTGSHFERIPLPPARSPVKPEEWQKRLSATWG